MEEGIEVYKSQRWGEVLWNAVLWMWYGAANMNWQQLFLPAQNLHKIQSVKNHSMEGDSAPEVPLLPEELVTVDDY